MKLLSKKTLILIPLVLLVSALLATAVYAGQPEQGGGTHFTNIVGPPSVKPIGSNTKFVFPVLQNITGVFTGIQVGELTMLIRANGTFTMTLKALFTGDYLGGEEGTLNVVFEGQGECTNPGAFCGGQPWSGHGAYNKGTGGLTGVSSTVILEGVIGGGGTYAEHTHVRP